MFVHSYLDTAGHLLATYDGSLPFAAFLKSFFAGQKKFGSRDRKWIAHLCYCWFRAGKALGTPPGPRSLTEALFLCSQEPNALLGRLDEVLNSASTEALGVKLARFGLIESECCARVFPFTGKLSPEIETVPFVTSHLEQPMTFLRLRPRKEAVVRQKLEAAALPFTDCGPDCLSLPNGTRLEDVVLINREAVVQDLSSQRTLTSLLNVWEPGRPASAWDCCAASGGKSLLLIDRLEQVDLVVSDIRESILHNLKQRFREAGVTRYNTRVLDVAGGRRPRGYFDIILCDAPCTGSGTWGRTPEQLYFFTEDRIAHYVQLQRRIAREASRALKRGGYFLYITCSVFQEENESVVAYLQEGTELKLVSQQYHSGYTQKADTLFSALFTLQPDHPGGTQQPLPLE